MSAARNARKATRKAGKKRQAAEVQQRIREVQRLTRAADLLASHVDDLDNVGRCREARALERKSIDLGVRAALLAADVPHVEPLPADVVALLDAAVTDFLIGDVASADQHRAAALDELRRDRKTHQARELTVGERAELVLAHGRAVLLEHDGRQLEAALALAAAEERHGPMSLLTAGHTKKGK